jgi:5'-deoxynucleotidase
MKNTQSGFLALALRQRFIKRWALMNSRNNESVLEHTAVVALLAYFAGELARQAGRDVNVERMMAHGLLHDACEVLVQDLISPVKNSNPRIAEEYSKLEKAAEQQLLACAPPKLQDCIAKGFECKGYEGKLTKGVDIYSAYIKCRQECAAGNELEYGDALVKMEKLREDICAKYPEINQLDKWFNAGLGQSIDELLKPVS